MNPEEFKDQATLYAAGALGDEERADFESYLAFAGGAEAAEVARLEEAAALAAAAALPAHRPRPELRQQVLAAVAEVGSAAEIEGDEVKVSGAEETMAGAVATGAGAVATGAGAVASGVVSPPGFSFLGRDEGEWRPIPMVKGSARIKELTRDQSSGYTVLLMDFDPDSILGHHPHTGAEDCYVLSGEIFTQGRQMHAGDFFHASAGTEHGTSSTQTGCRVLLVASAQDYSPTALRAYGVIHRVKQAAAALRRKLRRR